MKKLLEVEKETLLIRVLSQGRGSVEYARDLQQGQMIQSRSRQNRKMTQNRGVFVECAGGCRTSRKVFAARKEPVLLPM